MCKKLEKKMLFADNFKTNDYYLSIQLLLDDTFFAVLNMLVKSSKKQPFVVVAEGVCYLLPYFIEDGLVFR